MQASNNINNNKKPNCPYDNCNTKPKNFYKSDLDKNADEINDNISENNSVQTSYKYRKNKKGPNSNSSHEHKENYHYHDNYLENDYDLSYEMSENDNLICPNCINCTLIEEKRKRENLNNMRDIRDKDYERENMNALIDKNRDYDRDLINDKRRQREININNAYQNLAKIKAGMSNKDKLIQLNENSRNPLNEGYPDYQYQKFQDEYARRQKMINDNINKYYPNINKERPEVSSYYDNYVNNPNLSKNKNNTILDNNARDYEQYKNKDKNDYLRILEQQINEKNELKRREKEEDRRRGQRQYEEMQKELKREEQERYLKEQRQKEELIRGNLELINQKNQMKIKELEEKLKYRELCDRQNDDYLRELEKQKIEKEKLKDELYNQIKNEYEIKQKNKLLEKERNKINYDNNEYDYPKRKYEKEYDDRYKKPEIREGNDRQIDKNEYKNEEANYDYKDYRDKNRGHFKVKEKMGRCCRCHRIFPRKLLSINKYFYKENRV